MEQEQQQGQQEEASIAVKLEAASEELSSIRDGKPLDQKAFNKLYAELKEEQKKRRATEDEARQIREVLESLKEHNKELSEAIRAFNAKNEAASQDEIMEIDNKLADLDAKRKAARDSLDWDEFEKIEAQMAALRQKAVTTVPKKPASGDDPVLKAAVDTFKAEFKWAKHDDPNFDQDMFDLATKVEDRLSNDPEWNTKKPVEVLREVGRRVERRFNVRSVGSGFAVEGNSRVSASSGDTVHLDPFEVDAARKMGISIQDWAKQRRELEKERANA